MDSEWIHCGFKQCFLQRICSISREVLFNFFNYFCVLFAGGFLDFGGFLDSIGAVCGGWDSYRGWDG